MDKFPDLPLLDEDAPPRPRRRSEHCQCGDDLPGRCPGPDNCPFSDRNDDDNDQ